MPRLRLPVRLTASLAVDDDRALLVRFAEQRDEQAFAALVGRHSRMVYGVCKRLLRDEHLAEDAFQAVFLVLSKHPERIAAASSVGGWLFGIARRVGLAARRHEERQLRRAATVRPTADSGGFDDLLQVLDEELAKLPEPERAALIACFLEERTQDEAAKQLGWSVSTVRRRLERGKELLRARLTRRGATLAGGLLAGVVAPSARAAVPVRVMEPSPLAKSLAAEAMRGAVGVKLAGVLAALATLAGLGFAVANSEAPVSRGERPEQHTVAAPAPRAAARTPWVNVTGRVVFPEERDIPPLRFVAKESIKDMDFFGGAIITDVVIDPKTRGIANAVVWLRPDTDDRKATFPADKIHPAMALAPRQDHAVFAGVNGFLPRVIAARAGDRLVFNNPTPLAFAVNYQEGVVLSDAGPRESRAFNVLLPKTGTYTTPRVPALRSCDHFRDNIHGWIQGYVWAFDHPYFAVTDAHGNFTIPNAPAGTWRLMIWHEKVGWRDGPAGRFGEPITIAGDGTMTLGRLVHASLGWND